MSFAPWIAALAPAGLLLIALLPRANAAPLRVARLAFGAGFFSNAVALAMAVLVWREGAQATQTFGVNGAGFGLYLDALSVGMLMLVSFVGATVLRYSRNYLDGDPNHGVFIQRLCLTIASVQVLVIAGNLALLIAAWIATSLSLNRLLLFYPERRGAVLAARKKFVVSRLGDICLVVAALCLFSLFGGWDYSTIFAGGADGAANGGGVILIVATMLLAAAALLKSAQFPLHGWLLEVMETPTPVSALLHAGIINAGGFLIIRFAPVMAESGPALHMLAIVGGATALFGSLVMLTQTSVKVSLAYSTIAQMGFMLLQCGLGAFAAAFLHIVAHSLYKAHAFLSSGGVIDVLRTTWTPSPGGAPHPARFLVALALVLAAAAGVSALFGATLADKPGVFALGAVLMMSLMLLLANSFDRRPNAYVVGRGLIAAAGVGALYFALQAGAERVLTGVAPLSVGRADAFDLAIAALVIASFAAVTMLQSQMGKVAETPWGRALYVHLSHGFYVNTIANRLALQFWPARRAS